MSTLQLVLSLGIVAVVVLVQCGCIRIRLSDAPPEEDGGRRETLRARLHANRAERNGLDFPAIHRPSKALSDMKLPGRSRLR